MTRKNQQSEPDPWDVAEPDPWDVEEEPAPKAKVPARLEPRHKPGEEAQMRAAKDEWVVVYPEKARPTNQLDLRMEEGHRKFLGVLAKTGSLKKAQIASGLGMRALYMAKQKFPDFERNWEMAMEIFFMFEAEEKIRHRVLDGTLEPMTYQGAVFGYKRVYDSGLTQFWYKANMREKYGEQSEVKITGNINHGVAMLPPRAMDMDAWEKRATETLARQKEKMIDITPTVVDTKPVNVQTNGQIKVER